MGSPKHLHKKYETPMHPWEKTRIDEESELMVQYGFVNKTELWKMRSKLTAFKDQAKKLSASQGKQVDKETKLLLEKLQNLNLLKEGNDLNDILGIGFSNLLDRRLQSIVYRKSLARSMKQARQLITHRHIAVNNVKVTSPSYLVKVGEEALVAFAPESSFASEEHPERFQVGETVKEPEEKRELANKHRKDDRRDRRSQGQKRDNKGRSDRGSGSKGAGKGPSKGKPSKGK